LALKDNRVEQWLRSCGSESPSSSSSSHTHTNTHKHARARAVLCREKMLTMFKCGIERNRLTETI